MLIPHAVQPGAGLATRTTMSPAGPPMRAPGRGLLTNRLIRSLDVVLRYHLLSSFPG
jgi:hypothetical protein